MIDMKKRGKTDLTQRPSASLDGTKRLPRGILEVTRYWQSAIRRSISQTISSTQLDSDGSRRPTNSL